MGAKVEIPKIVGDDLIKRFGRRLRIVSEKDFQLMLGFMESVVGKKRVAKVDSEQVAIRGWPNHKKEKALAGHQKWRKR